MTDSRNRVLLEQAGISPELSEFFQQLVNSMGKERATTTASQLAAYHTDRPDIAAVAQDMPAPGGSTAGQFLTGLLAGPQTVPATTIGALADMPMLIGGLSDEPLAQNASLQVVDTIANKAAAGQPAGVPAAYKFGVGLARFAAMLGETVLVSKGVGAAAKTRYVRAPEMFKKAAQQGAKLAGEAPGPFAKEALDALARPLTRIFGASLEQHMIPGRAAQLGAESFIAMSALGEATPGTVIGSMAMDMALRGLAVRRLLDKAFPKQMQKQGPATAVWDMLEGGWAREGDLTARGPAIMEMLDNVRAGRNVTRGDLLDTLFDHPLGIALRGAKHTVVEEQTHPILVLSNGNMYNLGKKGHIYRVSQEVLSGHTVEEVRATAETLKHIDAEFAMQRPQNVVTVSRLMEMEPPPGKAGIGAHFASTTDEDIRQLFHPDKWRSKRAAKVFTAVRAGKVKLTHVTGITEEQAEELLTLIYGGKHRWEKYAVQPTVVRPHIVLTAEDSFQAHYLEDGVAVPESAKNALKNGETIVEVALRPDQLDDIDLRRAIAGDLVPAQQDAARAAQAAVDAEVAAREAAADVVTPEDVAAQRPAPPEIVDPVPESAARFAVKTHNPVRKLEDAADLYAKHLNTPERRAQMAQETKEEVDEFIADRVAKLRELLGGDAITGNRTLTDEEVGILSDFASASLADGLSDNPGKLHYVQTILRHPSHITERLRAAQLVALLPDELFAGVEIQAGLSKGFEAHGSATLNLINANKIVGMIRLYEGADTHTFLEELFHVLAVNMDPDALSDAMVRIRAITGELGTVDTSETLAKLLTSRLIEAPPKMRSAIFEVPLVSDLMKTLSRVYDGILRFIRKDPKLGAILDDFLAGKTIATNDQARRASAALLSESTVGQPPGPAAALETVAALFRHMGAKVESATGSHREQLFGITKINPAYSTEDVHKAVRIFLREHGVVTKLTDDGRLLIEYGEGIEPAMLMHGDNVFTAVLAHTVNKALAPKRYVTMRWMHTALREGSEITKFLDEELEETVEAQARGIIATLEKKLPATMVNETSFELQKNGSFVVHLPGDAVEVLRADMPSVDSVERLVLPLTPHKGDVISRERASMLLAYLDKGEMTTPDGADFTYVELTGKNGARSITLDNGTYADLDPVDVESGPTNLWNAIVEKVQELRDLQEVRVRDLDELVLIAQAVPARRRPLIVNTARTGETTGRYTWILRKEVEDGKTIADVVYTTGWRHKTGGLLTNVMKKFDKGFMPVAIVGSFDPKTIITKAQGGVSWKSHLWDTIRQNLDRVKKIREAAKRPSAVLNELAAEASGRFEVTLREATGQIHVRPVHAGATDELFDATEQGLADLRKFLRSQLPDGFSDPVPGVTPGESTHFHARLTEAGCEDLEKTLSNVDGGDGVPTGIADKVFKDGKIKEGLGALEHFYMRYFQPMGPLMARIEEKTKGALSVYSRIYKPITDGYDAVAAANIRDVKRLRKVTKGLSDDEKTTVALLLRTGEGREFVTEGLAATNAEIRQRLKPSAKVLRATQEISAFYDEKRAVLLAANRDVSHLFWYDNLGPLPGVQAKGASLDDAVLSEITAESTRALQELRAGRIPRVSILQARKGYTAARGARDFNLNKQMFSYVTQANKLEHLQPHLQNLQGMIKSLDNAADATSIDLLAANALRSLQAGVTKGYSSPGEFVHMALAEAAGHLTGDAEFMDQFFNYLMKTGYAAGIGYRLATPAKNFTQLFHTWALAGTKHYKAGFKMSQAAKSGDAVAALLDDMPWRQSGQNEITEFIGENSLGQMADKVLNHTMILMQKSEGIIRTQTFFTGVSMAREVAEVAAKSGYKAATKHALEKTPMWMLEEPIRARLFHLLETDVGRFVRDFGKEFVDATQWRYGAGQANIPANHRYMRLLYMYGTWPLNYANFVKRIVKTAADPRLSVKTRQAAALSAGRLALTHGVLTATFAGVGLHLSGVGLIEPLDYSLGPFANVGLDMLDYKRYYGDQKRMAANNLKRNMLRSFIPLAALKNDLSRSYNLSKNGHPMYGMARFFGASPTDETLLRYRSGRKEKAFGVF